MKFLIPLILWASTCLAETPVGWPACPTKRVDDSVDSCCRQVEELYKSMFGFTCKTDPRRLITEDPSLSDAGDVNIYRVSKSAPGYIMMGSSDTGIKQTIKVASLKDIKVVQHEVCHFMNSEMTGCPEHPKFIEEGTAEAFAWILHPELAVKAAPAIGRYFTGKDQILKLVFKMDYSKEGWREAYIVGAFFMIQINDLFGPAGVKSLLETRTSQFEYQLAQLCGSKGMSEKEFWIEIDRRAKLWSEYR